MSPDRSSTPPTSRLVLSFARHAVETPTLTSHDGSVLHRANDDHYTMGDRLSLRNEPLMSTNARQVANDNPTWTPFLEWNNSLSMTVESDTLKVSVDSDDPLVRKTRPPPTPMRSEPQGKKNTVSKDEIRPGAYTTVLPLFPRHPIPMCGRRSRMAGAVHMRHLLRKVRARELSCRLPEAAYLSHH